jgi:hypothetical protein
MTVLLLSLLVSGCNPLEEANNSPWTGYATKKDGGRFEWWFVGGDNFRDCIEMMQWETSGGRPNTAWYRPPLGCGYSGNNYWRVWMMNVWSGNMKDFECISRSLDPASTKSGRRYGPVLKGSPHKTDLYQCE